MSISSVPNNLCFVLGMHRSGTSATAGLLEGMGFSVGCDVMAATSANPLGYFENNAIVRFHNEVLAAMGSVWNDSCPLAERLRALPPTQIASWRRDLATILQLQFSGCDRAVIKDPRLCRLLPLWGPLAHGSKWPFLLVVRHPAAVAGSLFARDQISATKALALWLTYNLEMERETRAHSREFIFYPEILHEPKSSCLRLKRSLGVDFPEAEFDSLVKQRVRRELCHEHMNWPEAPPGLISKCQEVYLHLQQRCIDTISLDEIFQTEYRQPPRVESRAYSIVTNNAEEASETEEHDDESNEGWNCRTAIVNSLIALLSAKSYLEIGVGDGTNFLKVNCNIKMGIDPEADYREIPNIQKTTTAGFFAENPRRFDVILLNGLNHQRSHETELIQCLGSLNPGGVLVCDGLNPTDRNQQQVPGTVEGRATEYWKAWVKLRAGNKGLAMVVFDTGCGVGVIMPGRRSGPIIQLNGNEPSWTEFDRLRVPWLNLMTVSAARRFITERILESNRNCEADTLESEITHTSSSTEKSKETFGEEFDSQRADAAPSGTASAVLLFGVVHRSLPHVIHSLRKQLIEELARHGPVDIFFHSWSVPTIRNPRGREMDVSVDADVVLQLLPEARGIFESQEDFDETINWNEFTSVNPMRPFCSDDEEATITLMNLFRAAESLERVWRFFESTRQTFYRRVVVARPDVRFLERLPMPLELRNFSSPTAANGKLWIPHFHSWDGLNDRFVLGQEDEVRIWCQRREYLESWLRNGESGTSESILRKWLTINQVAPRSLNFVFQRVRANGRIEKIDRKLGNKSNAGGNSWNNRPLASGRWSEPPKSISPNVWPAGLYRQQISRSSRNV